MIPNWGTFGHSPFYPTNPFVTPYVGVPMMNYTGTPYMGTPWTSNPYCPTPFTGTSFCGPTCNPYGNFPHTPYTWTNPFSTWNNPIGTWNNPYMMWNNPYSMWNSPWNMPYGNWNMPYGNWPGAGFPNITQNPFVNPTASNRQT